MLYYLSILPQKALIFYLYHTPYHSTLQIYRFKNEKKNKTQHIFFIHMILKGITKKGKGRFEPTFTTPQF